MLCALVFRLFFHLHEGDNKPENINLKNQVTERAEPFLQPQGEMSNSVRQGREALAPAETPNCLSQMELGGPTPPRHSVGRRFLTSAPHITEALQGEASCGTGASRGKPCQAPLPGHHRTSFLRMQVLHHQPGFPGHDAVTGRASA